MAPGGKLWDLCLEEGWSSGLKPTVRDSTIPNVRCCPWVTISACNFTGWAGKKDLRMSVSSWLDVSQQCVQEAKEANSILSCIREAVESLSLEVIRNRADVALRDTV